MNPYKILHIDHRADKREIIQAVALAMQKRAFSGLEVAKAQKALLDPITRPAHEFLHFIDVKPLQEGVVVTLPPKQPLPDLKRLSIFDVTVQA